MNTLIIYSSQTGFTKKYADWIAEKLNAETMTIKTAAKKDSDFFKPFDTIIYGGWVAVEKIHKLDWFTSRIESWKDKKMAIFSVGASPATYSGIDKLLDKALNTEQKKYAKAFYFQGGLDYDKMSLGSKMLMKTFSAMLKSKKNPTDEEKDMIRSVSTSCDLTDPKYIEPLVEYITK